MIKGTFAIVMSYTVVAAIGFTSCQSNTKPASDKNAADSISKQAATANIEADDSTDEIILPSPLQIGSIFKHAGLDYMTGLTNPIKETSNYNSSYSQAVNMGVYAADLSYCVLNKQTQDALNYLKTMHALADKLGFGSIFESNNIAKRFQTNLNSEDSLTTIITDMQMEADTYLATNHQKSVSTITFAGAWVESMYIGSKVNEGKKSDKISGRISEQMTILENLIKALKRYKAEDTHITDMIASFKAMDDNYKAYDEIKNAGQDGQVARLTDAHIVELSKEIVDLRAKFIM